MTGVAVETWWRRSGSVRAVLFTGFGADGNGPGVLLWLDSLNVEGGRIGDDIVIDTGNDDLLIRAKAGDRFVVGVDDGVYRVKKHMWHELYEKRPTS